MPVLSSSGFQPVVFFWSGAHLLSHTVSSAVPSADWVLTVVFGMGTGVSPTRIATSSSYPVFETVKSAASFVFCFLCLCLFCRSLITKQWNPFFTCSSLERRWSSRTFRYGYLVTTSPQLSVPPSAAPSWKVGSLTSGVTNSHGVTGGVYKTRERIHRDILIRDY